MSSTPGAAKGSAPQSEGFAPTRSEPLLREAADCTPAPVWMTNRDGAMVFANRAFEEQAGVPAEQLMGGAWISYIHPEDLPGVRDKRAAAWAAGHIAYTYEARFRRHDGVWRWWEVSSRPRRDADGNFDGYVGMAIDRTDERATRLALEESEARYRAVVESQSEMICRFNTSGDILFVNQAYARSRNSTVEALTGASFWGFIPESERAGVRAMLDKLTPASPEVRIENEFLTADGPRWMLWTNRALRFDENRRWLEAQSTGIDIDDRKRAEEQRKVLLDELNHRVKNTLAVVQGIAYQTFRQAGVATDVRQAFDARLSALSKAHNLLTRTEWAPAPLRELIDEITHVCGPSRARIHVGGPDVMLPPRYALAMVMALHELATNAMKYGALSNDDGEIDLNWRIGEETAPTLLHISWSERGGPAVAPPERRGYGSMLIERALAHDLNSKTLLLFEPTGVRCLIDAPLI